MAHHHLPPVDATWFPQLVRASGLTNTGNTCYLNSALQCLLHTPPLIRVLIERHHQAACPVPKGSCMACAMRALVLAAHSQTAPLTPSMITDYLQVVHQFQLGRQEDSHEFLRYAIGGLQQSCLAEYPSYLDPRLLETSTWVHQIFGGQLRSRISCQACQYNSDTFDDILDFSLDILDIDTLSDAFLEFFRPDPLDEYKCGKCTKTGSIKQFSIHKAPVVLTIHLKRFSGLGSKIGHAVKYPRQLTLRPFMNNDQFGPTYSLYGVICHVGEGAHSGHYIACVKGATGLWYEMNDASVSALDGIGTSIQETAYVLFYMREEPPGTPTPTSHAPQKPTKPLSERESSATPTPTSHTPRKPLSEHESSATPTPTKPLFGSSATDSPPTVAMPADEHESSLTPTPTRHATPKPTKLPFAKPPTTTIPPASLYINPLKKKVSSRIPPNTYWKSAGPGQPRAQRGRKTNRRIGGTSGRAE